MKKTSKKNKIIILTAIALIIVIIGILIGTNAIKVNILTGKFNSANNDSSNGNLLPEYIKAGITLGGVTGTLEDLDTSDATATPEDILYGKTAYVNGKKITGTNKILRALQVGDYVAYTPDTTQSSYSLSSIYSGYTANQTINKENLSWRVFSINDDGTVDLISSTPTTGKIGLGGSLGYNNGVYFLNDICTKLYSNKKINATARNLKFEDIEKHLSKEGIEYIYSYPNFGEAVTKTSQRYYPNLYALENGSGINTTSVKTDGIGQSDSYYTSPTRERYSQAGTIGLTVTRTGLFRNMNADYYDNSIVYDLLHNNERPYYLATRCAADYGYISFSIRYVDTIRFDNENLIDSSSFEYDRERCFRPVVSLSSSIKIGSGDGKSESTAYELLD